MFEPHIQAVDDVTTLTLEGEVTVEHAAALHAALVASLPRHPCLVVQATALTRLDAAAIQVLLAAARAAEGAFRGDASPAWTASFARYGVADPFSTKALPSVKRAPKKRTSKRKHPPATEVS